MEGITKDELAKLKVRNMLAKIFYFWKMRRITANRPYSLAKLDEAMVARNNKY